MHAPERPAPIHVLIAGGGVAAIEAMLALRHLSGPRIRIELVSPVHDFCYRPMRTAEPFEDAPPPVYALSELTGARAARHRCDGIEEVDAVNRAVRLSSGRLAEYDFLLVAIGARAEAVIPGALTFWSGGSHAAVRTVLDELDAGQVRRVAFALPDGVTWPLPLYELALQTAARLQKHGGRSGELAFVTPERSPLEIFGKTASAGVQALMRSRGIGIITEAAPGAFAGGELSLSGGEAIPADRVIAIPRLHGPGLAGLPHDEQGFIPIDEYARVQGADHVFAAGDATTCPVKQGGVAAQQADAAAEMIARQAGARVIPKPFRIVLRGVLLTGDTPKYMRATVGEEDDRSAVSGHAFWWPPAKVAGRYLAPFLTTMQPIADGYPQGSVTSADAAGQARV